MKSRLIKSDLVALATAGTGAERALALAKSAERTISDAVTQGKALTDPSLKAARLQRGQARMQLARLAS